MIVLEIIFAVLVLLFIIALLYMVGSDFDNKEYHVTDDLTMFVLKGYKIDNGGSCIDCHFYNCSSDCPVDESSSLKCVKKDNEVNSDICHVWERIN